MTQLDPIQDRLHAAAKLKLLLETTVVTKMTAYVVIHAQIAGGLGRLLILNNRIHLRLSADANQQALSTNWDQIVRKLTAGVIPKSVKIAIGPGLRTPPLNRMINMLNAYARTSSKILNLIQNSDGCEECR